MGDATERPGAKSPPARCLPRIKQFTPSTPRLAPDGPAGGADAGGLRPARPVPESTGLGPTSRAGRVAAATDSTGATGTGRRGLPPSSRVARPCLPCYAGRPVAGADAVHRGAGCCRRSGAGSRRGPSRVAFGRPGASRRPGSRRRGPRPLAATSAPGRKTGREGRRRRRSVDASRAGSGCCGSGQGP